ncbi:MAG: hypothetical protein PHW59_13960 [Desulfobacterales bacterium]|nr:hypothetical protein [Desulfobacterales bacterium]
MSTSKIVTVLDDNVTLTAGAADHTSSVWTLDDGYGGQLFIKVTNGATGPTIAATVQVWASPDNSNWYKLGGELGSTLGNAIISTWSIPIGIGVEFVKVVSGSNTGQNVTIRVEGTEISAIS